VQQEKKAHKISRARDLDQFEKAGMADSGAAQSGRKTVFFFELQSITHKMLYPEL